MGGGDFLVVIAEDCFPCLEDLVDAFGLRGELHPYG